MKRLEEIMGPERLDDEVECARIRAGSYPPPVSSEVYLTQSALKVVLQSHPLHRQHSNPLYITN